MILIRPAREICRQLGGIHRTTLYRWIRNHGFPACKLPNGDLATTEILISEWIRARGQIQLKHNGKIDQPIRENDE